MEESKDMRANMMKAAEDAVGNLVYTVVFDTCNEIIATGADQEAVLACANRVVSRYMEGGVKVRKRPAPRAKTTKAPAKDKPVDAITAAFKKMNTLADNAVWIHHPEDSAYSYTTSIKLATGYPVRDNMTRKVVMVINDEATVPITIKDARVAVSCGLDVDYDSVVKQ
jgi:hypothetical protein